MTEDGIIRHYPKRKRNADVTCVANKSYKNYIKNISVPCSRQSSSSSDSLILEEVDPDKENGIEDGSKSRANSSSCSSEHNIETEKQKLPDQQLGDRQLRKRIGWRKSKGIIRCFGCCLEFFARSAYHHHIKKYEYCRNENVKRMRQDGANFITPVDFEVCIACGRYLCKGSLDCHLSSKNLKIRCKDILKELLLGECGGIKCYGCDLTFTAPKHYSSHIYNREKCREHQLDVLWKPGRTLTAPDSFQYCLGCGQLVYKLDTNVANHLTRLHNGRNCRKVIEELFRGKGEDVDQKLANELMELSNICRNNILQVIKTLPCGLGGIQCYGCGVTFTAPKLYSTHISNNLKRCRELQLEVLWKPDCTLAAPDNFQYCLGCGQLVYKLHKNMANHLNISHNGRKCWEIIEVLFREREEDIDQTLVNELRELSKICKNSISQKIKTLALPEGPLKCFGCGAGFEDIELHSAHVNTPITNCQNEHLEHIYRMKHGDIPIPKHSTICYGCGVFCTLSEFESHLKKNCLSCLSEIVRRVEEIGKDSIINKMLLTQYQSLGPFRCYGCDKILKHSFNQHLEAGCRDSHVNRLVELGEEVWKKEHCTAADNPYLS